MKEQVIRERMANLDYEQKPDGYKLIKQLGTATQDASINAKGGC